MHFRKSGDGMANPEHMEIIRKGARTWNEWREQHPEERIDLRAAVLATLTLTGADLTEAYLTGANMSDTTLSGACLSAAYLAGANLSRAFLTDACLIKADLVKADLTGADLTGADLTRAYLAGADLTGAKLFDTNLTNAQFDNTDFGEAVLGRTIFGNVDLSSARGLETAKHMGPSIIGIDTLYRSKGKIAEPFLRGAGVPENLIEQIPSLTEQPVQFYSCFISYSHKDKSFAHRLHDALQGRGIRCWLDEKQLLPGHNMYDEVALGILKQDKVLLCCSKHSLRSWWVEAEITAAFAKEQKIRKKRGKRVSIVIPLDLDGYLLEKWKDGKAAQLKVRLAADFKGWEQDKAKFQVQVERVVMALAIK